MSAAGLNEEHRWAPYLWIGIGVVALVVVLVLLWHRHRQRVADRTMGSTFTAAGFSALMDNLSWYGQNSGLPSGEHPVQSGHSARPGAAPPVQADLGYRAGLTAAGPEGLPGPPEGSQQDPGFGPPSYPPVPPPDVWSAPPPEPG